MKKPRILIYCYDFPPLTTVGANRPYAWSKHLNEFDIYPVVLTRKWKEGIKSQDEYFQNDIGGVEHTKSEQGEIIRIPYKVRLKDQLIHFPFVGGFLRKAVTAIELLFRWDSSFFDEKRFLEKSLNRLLEQERFDLILVTGKPFILFNHVMKVSVKFDTPYLLDYRDRWWYNENVIGKESGLVGNIISKVEERREVTIMSKSSGFIFVFDRLKRIYQDKFPNTPGHTIENGIDLELLETAKSLPKPFSENKFRIIYTGILYAGHNVELFTNSLLAFIDKLPVIEQENIECVFIGSLYPKNLNTEHLEHITKSHSKIFKLLPRVSHAESICFQIHSQILLKFSRDSQKKIGLGAKLSEYAATKNPILTIIHVPEKETPFFQGRNIQTICSEQKEIAQYLTKQYLSWKQGNSLQTDITDDEINQMSRQFQTEQLASLIKSTIGLKKT